MSYTIVISDSPYFFAMLIATAMAFAMVMYVWPRRSSRGGSYFTLLMIATGVWLLATGLEMAAADLPTKILCAKLSYVGVVFLCPLFLMFVMDYYLTVEWLKPKYVLLLMIVPAITLGLTMTNEWHGLVWSEITLAPGGGDKMAVYDHNVWFWLYSAYSYALCAIAVAILVYRSLRNQGPQRRRAMVILSAVILIIVTSILVVGNVHEGLDIIPFIVTIAMVFYGWYLFGGSVFDIVTLAQRSLIASMADGVLVLDKRDRILSINPAASRLIGAAGAEAGDSAEEIMARHPALLSCCRVTDEHPQEIMLTTADGVPQWLEARTTMLNDSSGMPTGRLIVLHDVTERKRSEEQVLESLHEKEVLLKEIHHRVKNNLQIISSLLSLQSGTIDPDHTHMLRESQNRIRSMAMIHEKLYRSRDLSHIDFADYVNSLIASLARSYLSADDKVKIGADVHDIHLDIDQAIPCGLIINELVSNSLKYAFNDGRTGVVRVSLSKCDNIYTLIVSDNGTGLPPEIDFRNTPSLGLQLVNTLVSQIEGTIDLAGNAGTTFRITFRE
jgi:PAS domain S-box